jgi:hypothetical protein
MKTPPFLQLSLRELFLLVALVATGLGWYREFTIAATTRDAVTVVRESDFSTSRMMRCFGEFRGVKFSVTAATPEWWAGKEKAEEAANLHGFLQPPPAK